MVPPELQGSYPFFVDDSLCASLEGTQDFASFKRVWRDGRWALETISTRRREPIGDDYFSLMMARMVGKLTEEQCNEAIRKLQQDNVVVEHVRYKGLFRDDRKI